MNITNVNVYDLKESIIASGYPMRVNGYEHNREITDKDIKRCVALCRAAVSDNPAHNQFLTGIKVNFDLTFSNKAWVEAERYRFLEFVSSASTMHRITKFDLDKSYNEYVDKRIIEIIKEKVSKYNDMLEYHSKLLKNGEIAEAELLNNLIKNMYLEILYSNPAGFEITARLTTNYRCLANIYKQRKNHRLPEWREFCKWIETLPYASEFIIGG